MIRVYSSNFSKEEYIRMAEMFRAGIQAYCNCGFVFCNECDYKHVCKCFKQAAIHCEEKAAEMVEP